MSTSLTSVRLARTGEAGDLATIHEDAWRHSYQGLIPHIHLSRMIARRGPAWWQRALANGMDALLLDFDGLPVGYATVGRCRYGNTACSGEIFELYVRPDFQGVGFGRTLFRVSRERLAESRLSGLRVWALSDNDMACAFYRHLGGQPVSEGLEKFGDTYLRKTAFAWG